MTGFALVPQSYPLYVAWYSRYTTKDDRDDLEDFAKLTVQAVRAQETRNCEVHLVIAWEVAPDTVPMPIVPDDGGDTGTPVYGLSKQEVTERYVLLAEANHAAIRKYLADTERLPGQKSTPELKDNHDPYYTPEELRRLES